MKQFIFVIKLGICATAVAVTSMTSVAQTTKFTPVYTDPSNGLKWGSAISGTYSNGCTDSTGTYKDSMCTYIAGSNPGVHFVKNENSDAAVACQGIGARLPTGSEYYSLIAQFDHDTMNDGSIELSIKGNQEMQSTFGDMTDWFWSSSVNQGFVDGPVVTSGGKAYYPYACLFNGHGLHCFYLSRDQKLRVRCVSN